MQAILGRKLGMTQIFDESGNVVPVTVLEAGPCPVLQKKTKEKDGYEAVQLGFDVVNTKTRDGKDKDKENLPGLNKPKIGHLEKYNAPMLRRLREVRVEDSSAVGEVVKADIFEAGQKVDISGVSKGKGYAGVIKRHNYGGAPASHGISKIHRSGCSNGSVDAARVFKGKKMPGQMGNKKVTTQGLTIAKVDAEKNLLLIKGSVPGSKGAIVFVNKSVKG